MPGNAARRARRPYDSDPADQCIKFALDLATLAGGEEGLVPRAISEVCRQVLEGNCGKIWILDIELYVLTGKDNDPIYGDLIAQAQ